MKPFLMRTLLFLVFAGGALLSITSCEKVIDLKIANTTSQVVIEGEVTDSLKPWIVQLSQSMALGNGSQMMPLRSAKVFIADATAGTTDTLQEAGPGVYFTSLSAPRVGVPGHRYELTVELLSGGRYTAVSTMPQKVSFDSLYIEVASFLGLRGAQIFPVVKDPPSTLNFYQYRALLKGKVVARDARDDRFSDGLVSGQPILLPLDDSEKSGDEIVVELQCIDAAVFRYFFLLFQSSGGAGGTAAAPGNPVNNITGGALGIFSAHTVQQRSVLIP